MNAIRTDRFRDQPFARELDRGVDYGGMFFRRVPAGYLEVYASRTAQDAICNLDGDATMNTVNSVTMAFAAGKRSRQVA